MPKKPKLPEKSFEESMLKNLKANERPSSKSEPKPAIKKRNLGFRALKVNVNKMNSSLITRTPIIQPPLIEVKVIDGPLTKKDEQAINAKAKPPFPKLSAFSVAAMVLSLLGYSDEVSAILKQLSTHTRKYSVSHRDILVGHLIQWRPDLT